MSLTTEILNEKNFQGVFLLKVSSAVNEEPIFTMDNLKYAVDGLTKEIEITGIQWNSHSSSNEIKLSWESTNKEEAITVYGNGKYGFDSFQGFKIRNPMESGATGNLLLSAGSKCNIILRISKSKGFRSEL